MGTPHVRICELKPAVTSTSGTNSDDSFCSPVEGSSMLSQDNPYGYISYELNAARSDTECSD